MSLEEYGVIKETRRGKYIYTPNCKIGIKVEAVRPFKGLIKRVTAMLPWYEIEVDGLSQAFLIHQNWVSEYGKLRVGEEIEGVIHTRHMLGWVVWYVRRVPSKEGIKLGI
jgi:hypothetical protein